MKKFIKRSILTLVSFWLLLFTIQWICDIALKNSDDINHQIWNEVATGKINADILFMGSSRSLVHYDPKFFKDELNLESYVLGLNSTGYDLQPFLQTLYLKNNQPPKIFVQNVDVGSFRRSTSFHKPPYLPYYSLSNMMIMQTVDKTGLKDMLIPMHKYRGYMMNYDKLFFNMEQKMYKGYIEKDLEWDGSFERKVEERGDKKPDFSEFDFDGGYKSLERLIKKTDELNIKLLLLWAPEYYERIPFEQPYFSIVKKRFREMELAHDHVYYMDFSQDTITYNKDLFYNSYHLNNKGVPVYNKKVADSLKTILTLKNKPIQ